MRKGKNLKGFWAAAGGQIVQPPTEMDGLA